MKNYHTFNVKYYGPTNYKGSRVKIYSNRFNQGLFISYDYSMNSIYEMAEKHLTELGFDIVGLSETKDGYILISNTFEPLR